MHHYHGIWNNGGFIGFHILGFLLVIALIFVLVRSCIGGRFYHHHNTVKEPGDSSIEIVKQRYAKGEISKSEYEKLLKDLK